MTSRLRGPGGSRDTLPPETTLTRRSTVDDHFDNDVLPEVHADRRAFVKGIVAVTAFSAPMIASYDLESLSSSVAHATGMNSVNSTHMIDG